MLEEMDFVCPSCGYSFILEREDCHISDDGDKYIWSATCPYCTNLIAKWEAQ